MLTQSIWNQIVSSRYFPPLDDDLTVDVVIIGGGITGISTALELSERGCHVAVLEAMRIGCGTTSHSTGNLYYTTDQPLEVLRSKYDEQTVRRLVGARKAALTRIAENVRKHRLDCDFEEVPWFMYAGAEDEVRRVRSELEAGKAVGIEPEEVATHAFPLPAHAAIRVTGQAQMNPLRYVQELARVAHSPGLQIFEDTAVKRVEGDSGGYRVHTTRGVFSSAHVVHATHTPKGVKFVQTLLGPYREYGIACRIRGEFPKGIFWGYYAHGEKLSVRRYSRAGESYLLVVGKPHKVGQVPDNVRLLKELESFARQHFEVMEVAFRWGGQHYRPADLLPYIGRESPDSRVYLATGYATDGLVYGTLAGRVVADLISGQPNDWTTLVDPSRKQPLKAARKFLKENLNVAAQYVKKLPGMADESAFSEVGPGEGRVIEAGGHKIAAYRDEEGRLYRHSAVCPHLGCIVTWNQAEKTWDCPCHASRFAADGQVLEGPAYHRLSEL